MGATMGGLNDTFTAPRPRPAAAEHRARETHPTVRGVRESDQPALVAFLTEAYPEWRENPSLAARYYAWKYFDLDGRATNFPSALIAEDEQGIAGMIGCLPFALRRRGITSPAGWISDWRLASRSRGQGLGRELLRRAIAAIPTLACVNGSEEAERLYAEFGLSCRECARTWLLVRHPLRYEWPRRRGVRKPAGLVRAAQHAARGRAPEARATVDVRLVEASLGILAQGAEEWPAYSGLVRHAGYLAWLGRSPVAALRAFAVEVDSETIGYLLMQSDVDYLGRRRARILDVLTAATEAETARQIFALAVATAPEADYIDATLPHRLGAAAQAAGFSPRDGARLWLTTPLHGDEEDWHVTLLDKDDAFRGARFVP